MSLSLWEGKIGKTQVVIHQDPQARTSMIKFYINVGSRDEIFPESKGLAHFCEHMIFRGTEKYPTSADLYKAFYQYGADYNGETGFDYTLYYAKVSPNDLDPICDLFFQMIFKSLLLPESLQVEKGIVLSELLKERSDPVGFLLNDLLHRSLFEGTILVEPIIGKEENIKNFNLQMVRAFIAIFYNTDNLTISINSPQDSTSIKDMIRKYISLYSSPNNYPGSGKDYDNYFDKWKNYINQRERFLITQSFLLKEINVSKPLLPPLILSNGNKIVPKNLKEYIPEFLSYLQKNKRLLFHPLIIDQTYLSIGFLTPYPFGVFETYVLELLGMVMAGSSVSRLFSILREKLGLIYFVDYERDNYKDSGSLLFYLGTYNNYNTIVQVISIIFEQLQTIRERSITQDELDLTRQHLMERLKITTEDSNVVASTNGIYMFYRGHPQSLEDILAQYQKITLNDLQKCARKILTYPNIHIGLVTTQEVIEQFPEN